MWAGHRVTLQGGGGTHFVVLQRVQARFVAVFRVDAESAEQLEHLHLHQAVVGVQHFARNVAEIVITSPSSHSIWHLLFFLTWHQLPHKALSRRVDDELESEAIVHYGLDAAHALQLPQSVRDAGESLLP